jgi:hypothetical protein
MAMSIGSAIVALMLSGYPMPGALAKGAAAGAQSRKSVLHWPRLPSRDAVH